MTWLVNGVENGSLCAADRGALYGDGLFETIGFAQAGSPLWARHMARLARGCKRLGLDVPDEDLLLGECRRLTRDHERSVIRVTITRGAEGRGYWPDPLSKPTRIVCRRRWPDDLSVQHQRGLSVAVSSIRLTVQPALAGLKHCNRLEQVLAARECQKFGNDEALLLDHDGQLAEAISSNVLIRIEGQWYAPDSPAAVAGIGQEWLLEQPELTIERRALMADALRHADAMLVINSIAGPRPVARLDGRSLVIDQDCRRIQQLWNQHLIPPCVD